MTDDARPRTSPSARNRSGPAAQVARGSLPRRTAEAATPLRSKILLASAFFGLCGCGAAPQRTPRGAPLDGGRASPDASDGGAKDVRSRDAPDDGERDASGPPPVDGAPPPPVDAAPPRPWPSCTAPSCVQAERAAAFYDSMGINAGLGKAAYLQNYALAKEKLSSLGFRHVRSGINEQNVSPISATVIARMTELGRLGFRFLPEIREFGSWTDKLDALARVAPYLSGIEGPNESDLAAERFSYGGATFPAGTRAFQCDLYERTRADARLAALPVLLASVSWGPKNAETWTVGGRSGLGLGDLEACADYHSMHAYTAAGDPQSAALASWHIKWARQSMPTKPLMSTESGYQVSAAEGITEDVRARYYPRILLEHFRAGVKRSFLFELLETSDGGFGLVPSTGEEKPAFRALKNLAALVRDDGDVAPGRLDYKLAGHTPSLRQLLLQRSDGAFLMVLWKEVKSTAGLVAPDRVTVTLNGSVGGASVHVPSSAPTPVQEEVDPAAMTVEVPDHPVVIVIRR